ncbi:anion permease, partial [Enterobacter mori]
TVLYARPGIPNYNRKALGEEICFTEQGGCITHFGGAAGPIIFAAGYNDIKSWWEIGTVVALCTFLIHMVCGIRWWNFLLQNGMLQS